MKRADIFTLRYDTDKNNQETAGTDDVFFIKGSPVPSRFNNMRQWSEQRDFLSSFGAMYEDSIKVEKGVYVERRHYAHKLAIRMRDIEIDYPLVTSGGNNNKMGVTIRLFTEGSLAFFAPKDGWPSVGMIGKQLRYLRDKWEHNTEFVQFLDCCDRLNDLSKSDLHEHTTGGGITTENKFKVIDDVYLAAYYVRCGLEALFPEDAERARGEVKGLMVATQQVVWHDPEDRDISLSNVKLMEIVTTDPEIVDTETERHHRAWVEEQEQQLEMVILQRREKEVEEAKIRQEELLQLQQKIEMDREDWEVTERKKLQVQIAVRQRMLQEEKEKAAAKAERAKKQIFAPAVEEKVRKMDKKEMQREKERKRQETLMKKNNKRQEKVRELAVMSSTGMQSMFGNLKPGMRQFGRGGGSMGTLSFETMMNKAIQFQSKLKSVEGPWRELGMLVNGDLRGYGETITGFAHNLEKNGQYKEALSMLMQVRQVMEEALGPDHPHTLVSIINFASSMMDNNDDLDECKRMYERGILGLTKTFGPDDETVIRTELKMGRLLCLRNEDDEAVAIHDKHDYGSFFHETTWPEYENFSGELARMGVRILPSGDFDRARPVLDRALKGFEIICGAVASETISCATFLAYIAHHHGDHNRALELAKRVAAVYRTSKGPDHPQTVHSQRFLDDIEAKSPFFYESNDWIAEMFGDDEAQFIQWVHDTKVEPEQGTLTSSQFTDLVRYSQPNNLTLFATSPIIFRCFPPV